MRLGSNSISKATTEIMHVGVFAQVAPRELPCSRGCDSGAYICTRVLNGIGSTHVTARRWRVALWTRTSSTLFLNWKSDGWSMRKKLRKDLYGGGSLRWCPLLAQSRHPLLHRTCLLLTQSGYQSTANRLTPESCRNAAPWGHRLLLCIRRDELDAASGPKQTVQLSL